MYFFQEPIIVHENLKKIIMSFLARHNVLNLCRYEKNRNLSESQNKKIFFQSKVICV